MSKQPKSPIRAVWRCFHLLVRAWPLMRYGAGQHDLICDATGTGKDYLDDGCTAYESVCVLMLKLEHARCRLEKLDDDESKETLRILNEHQDADEFMMLPCYGTGDSCANSRVSVRP